MSSSSSLERALRQRLEERKSKSQLRRLTSFPSTSVDFSSNSYLSLSVVPEVQKAYIAHLEQLTASNPRTSILGSSGSRLLDGNSNYAEALERDVAAFHHAPAGLLFNSGFDANVGLFSCVPQPGDVVVYDELVHASAHDGMRMSRAAQRLSFKHNTVSPARPHTLGHTPPARQSLSETLAALTQGASGQEVRAGTRNVFVAVEAVYSMDGDVAPLREIVDCIKQHLPRGNGRLIVDEAHSTGLFGLQGRGLVCELGLERDVFARLHTFGKAMGASGAILLCAPVVREYLINYARTLIYTTAMSPASLAGIRVTYDFVATEMADELRRRLRELIGYTHGLFVSICARYGAAPRPLVRIDAGLPSSPIIPLLTSHPRSLASYCQERGYIIRPIVAPTVPKGSERVRVCLHAANTKEEVGGLARVVEEWVLKTQKEGLQETQPPVQKAHL
ncbi:8-amino-7-oxononanoate synthase like protein [Verticillium longisporum]|uniref:8-amino-7-oxononanoate synthase like protein n=1 Tax=Verticillium longisporum TaxID=100787 RepID=A0A8I3AV10_VERLO|nr:8-amino-7-oxononanoate synthase like protein [Verticillium longisporum]